MTATTLLARPNPITCGQLVEMRDSAAKRAKAEERERRACVPYGLDDMQVYASQRYWQGHVDLLNGLIEQLGGAE